MKIQAPPPLLSIAGSDPVAGAGIQADLRAFDRMGFYGLGVVTTITAQNTTGVKKIYPLAAPEVGEQLRTLLADVRPRAMKTGMLATAAIAGVVAETLAGAGEMTPLVVDPVLASTGGAGLGEPGLVPAIRELLLPLCSVVTPNLDEAAALTGAAVRSFDGAQEAALMLVEMGAGAACVTGGHLDGDPADVLYDGEKLTVIRGRRAGTAKDYHGTGCLFSAALTAFFAGGSPLVEAAAAAHEYVAAAIEAAVAPGGGLATPWPPRLEPAGGNL